MRLRSLTVGLSFAATVLALASSPAHAEDKDKSRAAFKRGVAAAQSGDYATARVAFAEAYSLYARPTILLNLAIAEWKDGKYIDAEGHLTKYLADGGDKPDDDVASAQAAMRDVRAHVGVIRITVLTNGGHAFLDDQPLNVVVGQSTDVRANVGEHVLRVEADGAAPFRKDVRLTANDPDVENVTLVPWSGSGPAPVAATTTDKPTPAATDANASSDDGWTRHKTGWVLLGAGGVLAVVGTICGIEAIGKASSWNDAVEGGKPLTSSDQSDQSSGKTFRTLSDITFLGAIVGGGFGAYFLLTDAPEDGAKVATSKPSVSVGVLPGGMSLRGTF